MDKNYEIIQDILFRAIQITVTQKHDVSWEFYPLTRTLRISIPFNNGSLIKTYGVKVEDTECLKIIQKELMGIQTNNLEDDFLGD
ncbi:hypothetical protein [Clostridium botulinum]|uniref:Uncharacterized protein n=1 Tax=Clostridium botulinum (strain Langeland / NCTC 10281 / Type F) TaxID=441772 RepID=A7GFX3_CLOBL|nr:hypothetical protein [Clostridium botulinum]ABS40470.1 hypothetical protein CLI_2441 [Clostridium botulinum F str. Langeland]ADG00090.1 hypothetical protein CBF_2431 [Clostridium botulinum F str. 230613]KKM42361.1 hypothetical protein VT72_01590 [Clostridium botulinum]MBY6793162.1 hypothetical protein [Clostridium botulinum]MBY6937372.1 hypothetical protein [Clostridium botulinum]